MSPKIKMSDIHDDRDDDIIELSDEELKEILADDDFDDSEGYGEMTEIMPVPRKLRITVLPAGSLYRVFDGCITNHNHFRRGCHWQSADERCSPLPESILHLTQVKISLILSLENRTE